MEWMFVSPNSYYGVRTPGSQGLRPCSSARRKMACLQYNAFCICQETIWETVMGGAFHLLQSFVSLPIETYDHKFLQLLFILLLLLFFRYTEFKRYTKNRGNRITNHSILQLDDFKIILVSWILSFVFVFCWNILKQISNSLSFHL